MRMVDHGLVWLVLGAGFLGGGTSTALFAQPATFAPQSCSRCNIVDEGLWNQALVNQVVYLYVRNENRFFPVTVTGLFREGPFYVITWYDPKTGRRGKDDATNYYSYRSMQAIASAGRSPSLSQSENQEKTGWLASCAMARSDNLFAALIGRRGCCESTAAKRYGPDPIC